MQTCRTLDRNYLSRNCRKVLFFYIISVEKTKDLLYNMNIYDYIICITKPD